VLAQRRCAGIDHGIAERCTLRLERGDGRFELLCLGLMR
jgi:hypothetical protein